MQLTQSVVSFSLTHVAQLKKKLSCLRLGPPEVGGGGGMPHRSVLIMDIMVMSLNVGASKFIKMNDACMQAINYKFRRVHIYYW